MKKTILFVLALAVLAITMPAQARERHHQEYRQHGYYQPVFGTTFLGLLHQNQMMTNNIVYGIFNSQPVYAESYYGSRRSPEEELSRCVGRILKDARKNHQATTVEQAGAICSGQPIPSVSAPVQATSDQVGTVLRLVNRTRCTVFVGNPEIGQGVYLRPGEEKNATVTTPGKREAWTSSGGTLTQVEIHSDGDTVVIG